MATTDDPRILALIEELTGKIALTERALRAMASGAGPQRSLTMSEFLAVYTKVKGMSDERERGPVFALQLHGVYKRSLEAYARASGAELRALADAAAGGAAAEASQRLLLAVLQRQEELKLLDRFLVRLCGGIGGGGEAASGGVLDRARSASAEAEAPEALFCNAFMAWIYEPMHASIRDTVLGMLTAERNGEAVDRQAIRRVVALLHRYSSYERAPGQPGGGSAAFTRAADGGSSYQRQVHQPFVASASAYYAGASAAWLAAGVPVYLERVREALAREAASMGFYMPFLNTQHVLYEVQDILLLRQQRGVLEEPHSGMHAMLVSDRRAPLALLCALYQGVRAPRAGEPFFKPGYSHDGSGSSSSSSSSNTRSIYSGGAVAAAAAAAAAAASAADGALLEASAKAQADFTLERMRPMADIFYRYLLAQGEELLRARAPAASDKDKEPPDQPEFCRGVLALHARAGELLAQCFNSHPAFAKALEAAFTALVGARPPGGGSAPRLATTELLVHYADRVLKGTDKADEGVQQGELRRCLALFCLERDKDVLGAVYRSLMAKRLLRKGGTGSTPLERFMVTQLENAFGQHFTVRLSTMLEDIVRVSAGAGAGGGGSGAPAGNSGLMKPKLTLPDGSRPPFDFSCQVLTSGSWPAFAPIAMALPPAMAGAAAAFEAWYSREKGGSRRLAWCPAVGACTVRACYPAQPAAAAAGAAAAGTCSALPPREYDLELTNALQAAVLLVFNDPAADGLTPPAIAARLACSGSGGGSGGGVEVVRKLLHSLACGKSRVLRKAPEGGSIRDSDAFAYHAAFASAALRPAFPCPSLEETHDPARIDEERRFAIDACIVRVMKARKTLGHNELVGQVLHQLTLFQPKLEAIKKRIEDLIEREFLARVEGQPSQYAYIA